MCVTVCVYMYVCVCVCVCVCMCVRLRVCDVSNVSGCFRQISSSYVMSDITISLAFHEYFTREKI